MSSSKPVLPNPSSLSLSPHKGFARKFAEKRERERERHGAKTAWRRPRDDAMLVSRSSSPMRLAGERARDKDGERRRARWGKREGERGGVRRYFAVDAAGSIAWRAEEVEREPSERGTERRGGLERIGVCVRACTCDRVREREREGGMHRDGVGSSWREKDGETKSDSPTSFSLHAPLAPSTTTLTTARQPQESMHPGSLLPAANDPCAPSLFLSLSLPLCNSFPLPSSSSCRLEPLAPDLPSHAHASIINACVRGAGGVPRRV